MGTEQKFPARLHGLLASDSKSAVVIRRGPSKSVCIVRWDRHSDSFEIGQWLKGRIYERRADISPDGKFLIYFAMNGQWDSEIGGSWTAVSRVPFLKALVLLGKGDCWHGGGLFTNRTRYWLNDGHGHNPIRQSDLVVRDAVYQPTQSYGGECTGVYYVRLQREGWKLVKHERRSAQDATAVFERALPGGWLLRKFAHEQVESPLGRGCYWDEHELENMKSGTKLELRDWEWAERDEDSVVYASGGKLYRLQVVSQMQLGTPRELFNFNDMQIADYAAP